MRTPAPVTLPLLALVLSACGPEPAEERTEAAAPPAATQTAPADVEPIRGLVDRLLTAWNTSDTTALASIVADDIVLLQPDGPALEGRDAILDFFAVSYDPALLQQSATVDEAIALGPAHAYARGSWHLEPTGEPGPDAEAGDGKWSAVYRLGPDGQWRMWRWMWNQPSPAPAETDAG